LAGGSNSLPHLGTFPFSWTHKFINHHVQA
jgi:hypothetical protein